VIRPADSLIRSAVVASTVTTSPQHSWPPAATTGVVSRRRVATPGDGISFAQLVDAVQEIAGQELPIQHADPKQEAQRLVADSRRLRAALNWVPYRSTAKRIVVDAWDAWEAA